MVWYLSFQLFDGDIIHTFVNPAALYICHLVDEPELRLTRTSKDRNQDIFVTTRTSIRYTQCRFFNHKDQQGPESGHSCCHKDKNQVLSLQVLQPLGPARTGIRTFILPQGQVPGTVTKGFSTTRTSKDRNQDIHAATRKSSRYCHCMPCNHKDQS